MEVRAGGPKEGPTMKIPALMSSTALRWLLISAAIASARGIPTDRAASDESGLAEARRLSAEATRAPTEFRAPGPAFDSRKASGKTVWYIQYRVASPTTKLWFDTTA